MFDGWNLHAMMELVFRHLPCWGHCRWIRCSHFEQKHQAVKILWRNLVRDKAKHALLAILLKSALIHVLTGGYWIQKHDGKPVLVRIAQKLADELKMDTLLSQMVSELASESTVRQESFNVLVYLFNMCFVFNAI
jgi:hypothetical protein